MGGDSIVWLVSIFVAVLVQAMMRSDGKPQYKPEKVYAELGDHAL
jgi:hypothetical protein